MGVGRLVKCLCRVPPTPLSSASVECLCQIRIHRAFYKVHHAFCKVHIPRPVLQDPFSVPPNPPAPRGTRLCDTFVPVLSSCHSVPFWSVQSCLLAYCGVLISVFLFSGLPAICLLVASGPRRLVITLHFHVASALGPPARSHIYSISHTYATYGHHAA